MRQIVLDAALLQSHKKAGLKLVQIRPGILSLQTQNGHAVAYFSSKAPIFDIRRAANTWMDGTDMVSFVRQQI